jgi:hypothetical protein
MSAFQRRSAVNGAILAAVLIAIALVRAYAPPAHATGADGYGITRKGDLRTYEDLKYSLVGSYKVTATETDGKPSYGLLIVDIALAPSGSLEIAWGNGKRVGVGQLIGNTLAVASVNDGRTAILMLTVNADGSLAGTWSRRTDRGTKGTEAWKKM